jgi:hypothetical protein
MLACGLVLPDTDAAHGVHNLARKVGALLALADCQSVDPLLQRSALFKLRAD